MVYTNTPCSFTGIEELLQTGIPEAMKKLDYSAADLAVTALDNAIQEIDEEYAKCCSSVWELTEERARIIHGEPIYNLTLRL